ncbi:uncharacterized protein LOC106871143 [Argonauta hians]
MESKRATLCPAKSWDSALTEDKRSMSSNDLFTIQYSLRPSLIGTSNSCDFIYSFDENRLTKNKFRHSIGLPQIYESYDLPNSKSELTLTSSLSSSSSSTTGPLDEKSNYKSNLYKSKKPARFSLRKVFSRKKETLDDEVTLSNIENIHLANHLQCKLYNKWNKLWCVVAEGNFYCFKSNKKNEKIQFFLHLAESQLKYSSTDDQKSFLIEINSQNNFILLKALSSSDQICWINALTKEKVTALKTLTQRKLLCCDENACLVCPRLFIPPVLTPESLSMKATHIPASPEKSDYHSISSISDEKDHGYTTASDDFDNQSSVGSQNGISESYTPPSLRALAQKVALKLTENEYDNLNKVIPVKNHINWNMDSKAMAHTNSTTKLITPSIVPTKKPLCSSQWLCSPSHEETKCLAQATTTLTNEGGVQPNKRPVSLPLVEDFFVNAEKCKIEKLSSAVSITSLHIQPHIVMSGYLERKTSLQEWSKFWFVLKGNVLYCYPSQESQSTLIDYIDLNGSHVVTNSEILPRRQFTFQISTKDNSCSEYCATSEDSLTTWMNHLLTATESCSTSSPSLGSEGFFSSREDLTAYDPSHGCEDYKEKTKNLKQQLLADMFQQIKDIKQRQELRQNAESENEACDKECKCMTRLVQRRMSTQITLQSIQKQINNQSKKSLFGFGSGNKKKGNLSQKNHLVNQAEELNQELEQIDRSLHQHCTDHPEIALQSNVNLLSPDSPTKQISGIKHISNISKSFHLSSKPRLNIRPPKLRNNRVTKENRLSTPVTLSSNANLNLGQTLPNSSEDMFLKSLDLADGATKSLSDCSEADSNKRNHCSYPSEQTQNDRSLQTNHPKKESNLKISSTALSEIEAFEEFSKKFFCKQMLPSSNA